MMKKQTSATFALAGAIAVAGLLGAGAAQAACEDDWMDVARWVAGDVKAGVVAGDTWPATDPVPYPDEPGCAFCVHNYLQTRHGIVTQGELGSDAARGRQDVRLRVHLLAVPDPRRNRLARLADRGEIGIRNAPEPG